MDFEIQRGENENKGVTVTQDNALVSSSYRLTLDAKRLLLLGISKVDSQKNLWKEGEYTVRVHADEWREFYKVDRRNVYKQMKEGLADLYEANVIVKSTEDEGHEFRWISEQKYLTGEGWVEYSFTKNVLIYLNSLFNTFTTYKLLNVGGLRSIYSIRIYELAIQFRSTGWRKMTIEDFRETLGITDEQYRLFADLKKRVISPAIKEINQKTNLSLKFELGRKGRKYSHITLHFHEKAQTVLDLPEPESTEVSDFMLDIPKFGR